MSIFYAPNENAPTLCNKCKTLIDTGEYFIHDKYTNVCIPCFNKISKESRDNLEREMQEAITK